VSAICPGDVPDDVLRALHPEERQYAESLQGERRREWVSGRYCLAAALARFSAAPTALLTLPSGAPNVPPGTAGSISHKSALTFALAADRHRNVGIDVECVEDPNEQLAIKILTPAERSCLANVAEAKISLWVTAHFAVKEAIYKALPTDEQSLIEFELIELGVPAEKLTDEADWISVSVKITDGDQRISAAILQDGKWVIAAASR
jgi:4'-phosphopantetheinyl transferase EntD